MIVPRVAVSLVLVPGIDETLRVNGVARISTDKAYLDMFQDEKNPPSTYIEITIEEVFLHCLKSRKVMTTW